jgi:uncharacterized protein YndB with AHSA1/START domain
MSKQSTFIHRAQTIKKSFGQETMVSIFIRSSPAVVWSLLSDTRKLPQWNSTVVSIEGEIQANAKIKLISTLDEKRVFKLRIKNFEPFERLVWGNTMGNRVFLITERADGVVFTMSERIAGLMYPLFAKFLPPLDDAFNQFAADLKKAAEDGLESTSY